MDEEYFAFIKHFLRKTGGKKNPILINIVNWGNIF